VLPGGTEGDIPVLRLRVTRTILLFGLIFLLVGGLSLLIAQAGSPSATPPPPNPSDQQSAWNMELVGFNDLQGRSCYQPLVVHQHGREIAYCGHHAGTGFNPLTGQVESNGTSLVDVTDPDSPKYLAHIPGPAGSIDAGGSQMVRVCSGDVLPSNSKEEAKRKHGKWYLLRTHGNSSGVATPIESQEIYDVTDPAHPSFLKTIVGGLSNTHKNWWECDTGIAYLVANIPSEGWRHSGSIQHLKIYNLHDPANPEYIRDFGLVGQQPAGWIQPLGAPTFEGPVNPPSGIHGPISGYPARDRVYMAYGVGSNGVVQIVDREKLLHGDPKDVFTPQISFFNLVSTGQGGHTSFPIYKGKQDLLLVVSEEGGNECTPRATHVPHLAWLYDISKETTPTLLSTLSVPENPGDFCNKGGRFGAHASTESFYRPYYGRLAIISWFNAGVRVWDIRDPANPLPAAYFIPAPNQNTFANCALVDPPPAAPDCKNAIQTNNVELDDRGLIYIADRAGTGMHILRLTGHAKALIGKEDNGDKEHKEHKGGKEDKED
jgi:hypothetical protein